MRESYWGYWLVILGIFVIGVMLLVNNISTNNTQDYYNVKEVTQASMVDAIDFSYLRLFGKVKISETKFVENFYRRFAENVNGANIYDVDIYDVYEVPPKVSVKISSGTRSFNIGASSDNSYETVTTYSAILELGATGEETTESHVIKSKKKVCSMNLSSPMIEYFKNGISKDGKYSLKADRDKYNFTIDAEDELQKVESSDDFKKWFNKHVIFNGKTAKDYLAETKWEDLNGIFKEFKSRGWISVG